MANRTATILNRICRQTDTRQAHVADRDLLHRFATGHDQAAFATLVERHATMVFNVCRRYLSSVHDAEDACQATFLILVRQACQVRWQTSIANWLHTTARRVSARARRTTERRLKREARVAVRNSPSALDEISGRELLNILDEELGKLPAYYREAIVLCCLEGLSREEAADRIGVLAATLKTRLERGRRRLEAALIRRGAGLGVLLLATTSLGACPPLIENILSNAVGTPTPMVSILAREIPMSTLRNVLIATLGAFAVLGLGLGLHFAGPATANEKQPLPVAGQSVSVAFAPSAKAPADKFLENVAIAREKAILFLIKQQTKEGNWEGTAFNLVADMEGGTTALVVLSLLEAGVPAKDPAVAKAIDYLVTLPPKKTYVVSLQTQVLARADAKKHAVQIQKNADWLVDRAIGWKKDAKLVGWSYPGNSLADGSNTHFAVMGLHAASATAKVDVKIWEAVRDHYVQTRKPGGWAYAAAGAAPATESMTTAALVGLALAKKHEQATDASKEALEKGTESLLAFSPNTGKSSGYQALVVAELGRLIGSNEFKSGDKVVKWYRDGTERLLKNQQEDGSWAVGTGIDGNALMSTAFSLFFLGPVQK